MFTRLTASAFTFAFVIGAAGCMGGHRIEQALAPGFPDLKLANAVEVRDEKGQVLVSGAFATTSEDSDEITRTALLSNPANDDWEGIVEIEIDRDDEGMTEEDEILLKVDGLPDETRCIVMFDELEVTSFMTDDDGEAEVHLKRDSLAKAYNE